MAEHSLKTFFDDIIQAVGSADEFSGFITDTLISEINPQTDTIEIGSNKYSPAEALHHFRSFLISPEAQGYRNQFLPKISTKASNELISELISSDLHFSIDPKDNDSYNRAKETLKKVIELHRKYSQSDETTDDGNLQQAVEDGTDSLTAQIAERAEELRKLFKLMDGPHLKEDDKKLEETPEEDKDKEEDKERPEILKEKKERREKRSEILKKFAEKTAQEIKKHKEQSQIADSTLQQAIYSTIEEESTSAPLDPIIVAFLVSALTEQHQGNAQPQGDYNRTYNWTREEIAQALQLLHTFVEALKTAFTKLQEETAKELGSIASTSGAAPVATEAGGAEGEEEKTDEEEPAQKLNTEQEKQARSQVVSNWLSKITAVTSALNPARRKELYLALKLGPDEIATDTAIAKQKTAVDEYIQSILDAVTELAKAYDDAATQLAAGEDIDEEYAPPSAQHLNSVLETLLNERLLAAWNTVLKEETPEKQQSNVPVGLIKELQEEQAAAAQTAAQAESPQALSDKIDKISRVQHDMLLVAEGELRLKLESLGLQGPQIEKIISDNRMLLLDTIRYKAFALAADEKIAGSSQIVRAISDEVESFYQKLVTTYSDPKAQPQMAGYLAKADKATQDNIRNGLKALGWSDNDIYDVISNLEQSKFGPLVEYARANGYLSGATGLAQVLVKHNLVKAEYAQEIANELAGGNLGALIVPKLSGLTAKDKAAVIKKLTRYLERRERGELSSQEQMDFNEIIRQLLGRNAGDAVIAHMSRITFADLHAEMSHLQRVLAAADGAGDLGGRPSLAGPLVSFAGSGGAPSQEEVFVDGGMSDREKFMLEVSLAEAYRRMASSEDPATIEVEIALIVHQFTTTGSPKGGLTAQFYSDIEDGEKQKKDGGLAKIHSDSGIQTDQLSNAQRQSYKGRVAGQQGNAKFQDRAAQMQLAAKLLRTGGNPAAIAATLLSDAQARKLLIKKLQSMAAGMLIGVAGQMAVPIFILGAVSQIPIIGPIVGSIFSSIFGLGKTAATGAQVAAPNAFQQELGRGIVNASRDAATTGKTQFARARPGIESGTKSTLSGAADASTQLVYNVTSSVAPGWLAGTAILGPFTMAAFFTIIVITVIGGSLNSFPADNPFFAGRQNALGIEACWPSEGLISSYLHPASRLSAGGTAIDIAAPVGTAIYTPFGGRAKYITSHGDYVGGYGAYGKYVRVSTDRGFDIILAHMSAFAGGASGDTVTVVAGQQVGFIGNTGNSRGPHVHYELLPTPGQGDAPYIYDVIPPLYPPTSLSPAAIQSAIAAGTSSFRTRFADCTGTTTRQSGTATQEPTTENTTNSNGTTNNQNNLLPPPADVPTDAELDAILQPITLPNGGN